MNEIKLSVSDENLDLVQSILNNLKEGLIEKLEINGKSHRAHTRYQPKVNKIIREEDSGTNDTSGKYASVSAYRKKLKR